MEAHNISADYSQFQKGDEFSARIASVKDNCFFYIVKDELSVEIPQTPDSELFWIPALYETFFTRDDKDKLFRCARIPVVDDDGVDDLDNMKIYLLDSGETFLMGIQDIPEEAFFEMPESVKKVPGLAIRCSLSNLKIEHQYQSDISFLSNNLYVEFLFEVVDVHKNELKVNVSSMKSELQLTKAVTMTAEEVSILYEEHPITDNALEAVQGFVTRDDHRLCKHYDPEIGGCFKGGRCQQRHQLEIKDGSCRDAKKIHFSIPKALPLPALHSKVKIDITYFFHLTRFLCRYSKLKDSNNSVNLKTLIAHMNNEEEVKTYVQLKYIPAIQELVFFKSCDEKFYRARIDSIVDEKTVKLLLVDLGTFKEARLNRLYEYCERFNYLSFQTVEMEIYNIRSLPQNTGDKKGIAVILEYLQQSHNALTAVVFENIVAVKVKLINKHGEDIGQELVDRQLALEKETEMPTPVNGCGFLPG